MVGRTVWVLAAASGGAAEGSGDDTVTRRYGGGWEEKSDSSKWLGGTGDADLECPLSMSTSLSEEEVPESAPTMKKSTRSVAAD